MMTDDVQTRPAGDHDPRCVLAPVELTRRRKDGSTYVVRWRHPAWYEDVARLWRIGLNDGEIARALDRKVAAIYTARAQGLKLPANAAPGEYLR